MLLPYRSADSPLVMLLMMMPTGAPPDHVNRMKVVCVISFSVVPLMPRPVSSPLLAYLSYN